MEWWREPVRGAGELRLPAPPQHVSPGDLPELLLRDRSGHRQSGDPLTPAHLMHNLLSKNQRIWCGLLLLP